jgi:hypothetical protein
MFNVLRLSKIARMNGTKKTPLKQLEKLLKIFQESRIMKKSVI